MGECLLLAPHSPHSPSHTGPACLGRSGATDPPNSACHRMSGSQGRTCRTCACRAVDPTTESWNRMSCRCASLAEPRNRSSWRRCRSVAIDTARLPTPARLGPRRRTPMARTRRRKPGTVYRVVQNVVTRSRATSQRRASLRLPCAHSPRTCAALRAVDARGSPARSIAPSHLRLPSGLDSEEPPARPTNCQS